MKLSVYIYFNKLFDTGIANTRFRYEYSMRRLMSNLTLQYNADCAQS